MPTRCPERPGRPLPAPGSRTDRDGHLLADSAGGDGRYQSRFPMSRVCYPVRLSAALQAACRAAAGRPVPPCCRPGHRRFLRFRRRGRRHPHHRAGGSSGHRRQHSRALRLAIGDRSSRKSGRESSNSPRHAFPDRERDARGPEESESHPVFMPRRVPRPLSPAPRYCAASRRPHPCSCCRPAARSPTAPCAAACRPARERASR
jgi:hypothetical protein